MNQTNSDRAFQYVWAIGYLAFGWAIGGLVEALIVSALGGNPHVAPSWMVIPPFIPGVIAAVWAWREWEPKR